ncbi:histidine phosphatase family protein [Gleimia hominis]|uniref:Histidine phosphatase family protein n=1 Tax=Gleimia hominis TaxID=595468 RepID=A0ABU3ICI0_9ACTO|nr:histidine phosphatase family protein [Gleimia hominis]MDT3768085.1 histidine phosphatase family protein [Gleimia hominis]
MRVVLMRHGEANWGYHDLGRPLTTMGMQQAGFAARHIARYVSEPLLLTSPAARAQQSAQILAVELGVEPIVMNEIYYGDEDDLCRLVTSFTDPQIVVVGHMPTVLAAAENLVTDEERQRVRAVGGAPATHWIIDRAPDGPARCGTLVAAGVPTLS